MLLQSLNVCEILLYFIDIQFNSFTINDVSGADQAGEEISATNVNHIRDVNMATAMDLPGNVSATRIGEEFCATKVSKMRNIKSNLISTTRKQFTLLFYVRKSLIQKWK